MTPTRRPGCSRPSTNCRFRSSRACMAPRSAAAPGLPLWRISPLRPQGAIFGFTEVRLGLIPAVIAPYVLAKIGPSAARELFLTGRRFDADRALRIGLVHAVVPVDQLDRVVQEYVDDLLAGSRDAIAAAKVLLRRIANSSIEDATPLTVEAIAQRRASPDAQERMKAFLKRT